jgi:hypothetical protein
VKQFSILSEAKSLSRKVTKVVVQFADEEKVQQLYGDGKQLNPTPAAFHPGVENIYVFPDNESSATQL